VATLVAATLLSAAGTARAQVDCASLPDAAFVPGTTDVKPLLARIAGKLATAPEGERVTVVYQGVGSCTAIDQLLAGTPLTGTASYWAVDNGATVERMCNFPAGGVTATAALSDVTTRTCRGTGLPAGFAERSSVTQTFGFVVPPPSSQQAITAEEAYVLLKYGAAPGLAVAPWTDPALVAVRTPAASTQLLIGLAAGVPGTMWSPNLTNVNSGSSAVVTKVAAEATTGNAERTIGILSTQRYDENRDKLRMLAFQAYGQACTGAVWPDSAPTALDKRNVRDGHYDVWGYLWTVVPVGADGKASPPVERLTSFLAGTRAVNGADPIADAAKAGAVPACAMKVRRARDGGPATRWDPPEPCGCAFEALTGATPACAPCAEGACPAGGVCRFGYCEAR
jgi:hypothetical protein